MRADSAEQLEQYFEQAMARGNEGLMIKDLESPYMPGRRGRWWLKLKRELATLDVVVTAAEFGHGKRIHVLSDYTFAVRKGEELVNIGKAYSGLTDKEIAELTEWFLAHTTADHGHLREVEPKIVLEVAFNAIMRSDRHDSGFALRFPRIVRVRQDKLPRTSTRWKRWSGSISGSMGEASRLTTNGFLDHPGETRGAIGRPKRSRGSSYKNPRSKPC